jgi:GDP-4-dehydro-6-deoxy-D-mannose reductase
VIALVIGAGGFVGRHLVAALHADGWQVVGAGRSGLATGLPAAVEMMRGDIRDDLFLREVFASQHFDAIFHLAGLDASATAMELYRANVLGTAALLGAVRGLGRPELKIVLLGSSAQYGAARDNPITEESVADPVTSYGVSKACCDMMGRALFKETGQNVFRARAFNVVGPGQSAAFLQGRIVKQITEAEEGRLPPVVTTGDLSAYRDFIDVRDVAAGLIAIAKSGNAGEAYNLCSGQAVQTSSLVGFLVGLSRIRLCVETGGRKTAGVDVPYQRGSFEKLRCHTGWSPRIALERSLADALDQRRHEFSSQNVAFSAGAVRP